MQKNKIFVILGRLVAIYFIGAFFYLWLSFNGSIGDKIYLLVLIILVLLVFFSDKIYRITQKMWRVITNKE